jgi:hypothetical protein
VGNFYTNITLNNTTTEEVRVILAELGCCAVISPASNRYTVVSEKKCEEQDRDILKHLAAELAKRAECQALAVLNHDDSYLTYDLYDKGNLVDSYCSLPSYFSGQGSDTPVGGDGAKLLKAFGIAVDASEMERVLRASTDREDAEFVLEIERHSTIASLLKMPSFVAGFGFNYVSAGEVPEGLEKSDLITTGGK